MITKDSKHKDFIKMVKKNNPCDAAVIYMENWYNGLNKPEIKSKNAMTKYKEEKGKIPDQWIAWLFGKHYEEMDDEIRMFFLENVQKSSIAKWMLRAYDYLNEEEIKYLENIVNG